MTKTRVHVGNDPYVVRTAIQSFLAADPRFDAILVGSDEVWPEAQEGDILIVSGPRANSTGIVVILGDNVVVLGEDYVQITSKGSTSSFPYEGLPWFAELLAGLLPGAPGAASEGLGPSNPQGINGTSTDGKTNGRG